MWELSITNFDRSSEIAIRDVLLNERKNKFIHVVICSFIYLVHISKRGNYQSQKLAEVEQFYQNNLIREQKHKLIFFFN